MSQTRARGYMRRLAWLGAGALAFAAPGSDLAHAAAGTQTTNVGAWTLSLDNGSRECRVTLRPDVAAPGYAVAMPVGCHRAFPVLGAVAIWTEPGDGKLQFDDSSGQPVLNFEPADGGALKSTSPDGAIYVLQPIGPHKPVVLTVATAAARIVTAAGASTGTPKPVTAKLPLPSVAEMAGHYAVLRDKAKDTGCMVTFDDKSHGPKGSLKANLAPACRDQGIVIFDPVGWQLQGGHLVLTARKGHTTRLDLQEDGSWLKDPKDGKSLSLKRM